ncbi:MAG: hypothetical protein IKE95_06405 [Methanobrevibacter sp.]|nr:hypothetical protein [Methanobrevibacter sp.]
MLYASFLVALDSSFVFKNYIYYALYVVGFATTLTGCVLLSLSGHKMILIKDQKEYGSSLFYLVMENLSIVIAALILEKDILFLLTSKFQEPLMPMAHIIACSLILMAAGIIGLSTRRIYMTPQTIISFCLMAMAIIDSCKVLFC